MGRKLEMMFYPALACCLDGIFTITGQPASYFQGNFSSANELNPIGHLLLSLSPTVFAASLALWILAFSVLIWVSNDVWAARVSLVITGLHVFGVATWLVQYPWGVVWVSLALALFRFAVYPRYNR